MNSEEYLLECLLKTTKTHQVIKSNEITSNQIVQQLELPHNYLLTSVIKNLGLLYLDNNWIRLYGSGNKETNTPSILDKNKDNPYSRLLIVADDIVGGLFALNMGYSETNVGNIFYFAPDTMEWEDLDLDYTNFVYWLLLGDTTTFYLDVRWNNWQQTISTLTINEAISIYPPLFTDGEDLNNRSKQIVPSVELCGVYYVYHKQLR